jgi:hypothetical protein
MRKLLIVPVLLAVVVACQDTPTQPVRDLLSPDEAVLSSQVADRATGEGVRQIFGGDAQWTFKFDAHGKIEMKNGNIREAKGTFHTERVDILGDNWWGSVTCAHHDFDTGLFYFGGDVEYFSVGAWGAGYDYFMVRVRDKDHFEAGVVPDLELTVSNSATQLSAHCVGTTSWPTWQYRWAVIEGTIKLHQYE